MKPMHCVRAVVVTAIVVAGAVAQAPPGIASTPAGPASSAAVECPNDQYPSFEVDLPSGLRPVHEVREIPVGTTFSVALADNPTTPFTWSESRPVGADPSLPLVGSGYVSDPNPSGLLGIGGTRYFCYRVMSDAKTRITFTYHHLVEPQTIHRVIFDVVGRPVPGTI